MPKEANYATIPMGKRPRYSNDAIQNGADRSETSLRYSASFRSSDPTAVYLHEIGQFPVFTTKEERAVVKRIEKARVAVHLLRLMGEDIPQQWETKFGAVSVFSYLDKPEKNPEQYEKHLEAQKKREERFKTRYKDNPDDWFYARKRLREIVEAALPDHTSLVEHNLRLVISIAKKKYGRGLDLLDLTQEGNKGLLSAAAKYSMFKDYKKNGKPYKFSTYASWWIKQAIDRGLADTSSTIRMPVHVYEDVSRAIRARDKLAQDLGYEPTTEELARKIGKSPALLHTAMQTRAVLSLNMPVGDKQNEEFGEVVSLPGQDETEKTLEHVTQKDLVDQLLSVLEPKERTVVELRMGLNEAGAHTLEQVGQQFHVTRERIRQIEVKAFRKMRVQAHKMGLNAEAIFQN